mmetsp:Transcript_6824/g.17466  ORF Transcript_6824/g.17466 Transcript_6824/m.17466 type:complete len:218 (-) Transcript_6824:186-839(-)
MRAAAEIQEKDVYTRQKQIEELARMLDKVQGKAVAFDSSSGGSDNTVSSNAPTVVLPSPAPASAPPAAGFMADARKLQSQAKPDPQLTPNAPGASGVADQVGGGLYSEWGQYANQDMPHAEFLQKCRDDPSFYGKAIDDQKQRFLHHEAKMKQVQDQHQFLLHKFHHPWQLWRQLLQQLLQQHHQPLENLSSSLLVRAPRRGLRRRRNARRRSPRSV